MNDTRFCDACGQLTPEVRKAEAIEARLITMRSWCQQNGKWVSPDDRVDEATAAELLGVSPFTMRNWRSARQPLAFFRVRGRGRISYRLRDLAMMIEEGE